MANTTAIRRTIEQEFDQMNADSPELGETWFVSSVTGSDTTHAGTDADHPKATLAAAITAAAAGDTIILLPGHAESGTAITVSKRLAIIGKGVGRGRAAITFSGAAEDLIKITAANCLLRNVRLIGGTNATALIDVGAADFTGEKINFEHGAAPTVAVTISAGARFQFIDCHWLGTAAGPDACISIEARTNGWRVVRPIANYGASSGLDDGFIICSKKCQDYAIIDPCIVGFDAVAIDINSSVLAVGDGVCLGGGAVASGALTFANTVDAGGCAFVGFRVTDAVQPKELWPAGTPD